MLTLKREYCRKWVDEGASYTSMARRPADDCMAFSRNQKTALGTRKLVGTQSCARKEDAALHPSLLDACCRLVIDVKSRWGKSLKAG